MGGRLDKALAAAFEGEDGPPLSRSRLRALIETGAVRLDGRTVLDPSEKVKPGAVAEVDAPPPAPIAPIAEAIPLAVVYEDADLIVVDKPPGMAAHPAPGSETGTLVNALLHHCGATLSGVGGAIRPGIVHRIDKETSGLLVVAKSDAAHQGLAAQFAAHSVERSYLALSWGAPDSADPRLHGFEAVSFEAGRMRIEAPLARHRNDRKRMAVVRGDHPSGKRAVTWVERLARYGPPERPVAALLRCRLETGRTHQIRVHLTHVGHALIGDPVYGRPRPVSPKALDPAVGAALIAFPRQALHAETLGFDHPVTGEALRFDAPPPDDLAALIAALEAA
ncbi:MAG: RluA family pseudouridine synthase [Pseudomonadota bacterium]